MGVLYYTVATMNYRLEQTHTYWSGASHKVRFIIYTIIPIRGNIGAWLAPDASSLCHVIVVIVRLQTQVHSLAIVTKSQASSVLSILELSDSIF